MKTSEKWFTKPTKILAIAVFLQIINITAFSQCQPYIKVDGNIIIANQTVSTGLTLPLWLKETQTIEPSQMVNSISVLEFTINGTSLEFSQILSVTSASTVPSGKAWKVESILKQPSAGNNNSVSYTSAGSYIFYVPSCANYICIEVWGGGGGGGGGSTSGSGGGGGGGGYGQQCISVTPGSSHTVTVGAGGNGGGSGAAGVAGGATSVGSLISVNGGGGGSAGASAPGGAGGTGTATVNIPGQAGKTGSSTTGCANVDGGASGNGGAGGHSSCNAGVAGTAPGGGGSSGTYNGGAYSGGAGAVGKVIISW